MPTPPLQQRYPFDLAGKVHPEVEAAIKYAFSGLLDLNQANREVVGQIKALQSPTTSTASAATASSASASTPAAASGVTSFNARVSEVLFFPSLGTVNGQGAATSYTTTQGDNGAMVVFTGTAAIALTLATTQPPWFCFVSNQSTAVLTLTPASGSINGASNLVIQGPGWACVYFDGSSFWALGASS